MIHGLKNLICSERIGKNTTAVMISKRNILITDAQGAVQEFMTISTLFHGAARSGIVLTVGQKCGDGL